mgnify:CR=1 FL=1
MKTRHFQSSAWIACLLAGVLLFLPGARVQAEEPASILAQETEAYCLGCHADPTLSLTLPSGEVLSLYIDPLQLAGSVHSPQGIECEACHTAITTYPHPALEYQDTRSLSRAYYQACQKCHPDNYDQTLDSMHFRAAESGNLAAPICTDCHGAHDVGDPDEPRAKVSTMCSSCHAEIYAAYQTSIHGKALIEDNNTDVPVCTDCHGVHRMPDPRTEQFRIASPEQIAGREQLLSQLKTRECVIALEALERKTGGAEPTSATEIKRLKQTAEPVPPAYRRPRRACPRTGCRASQTRSRCTRASAAPRT